LIKHFILCKEGKRQQFSFDKRIKEGSINSKLEGERLNQSLVELKGVGVIIKD